MEFERWLYNVGKATSSSNFFGQLTYIQQTIMLQCGDQYYTKDETLSNRAYLALHLLAMELVGNDVMWQYFLFFSNFSFNEIHKAIFCFNIWLYLANKTKVGGYIPRLITNKYLSLILKIAQH